MGIYYQPPGPIIGGGVANAPYLSRKLIPSLISNPTDNPPIIGAKINPAIASWNWPDAYVRITLPSIPPLDKADVPPSIVPWNNLMRVIAQAWVPVPPTPLPKPPQQRISLPTDNPPSPVPARNLMNAILTTWLPPPPQPFRQTLLTSTSAGPGPSTKHDGPLIRLGLGFDRR